MLTTDDDNRVSLYGLDNWLARHTTSRDVGACTISIPPDLAEALGAAQDAALASVGISSLEEIYHVQREYSLAFEHHLRALGWTWTPDPLHWWNLIYTRVGTADYAAAQGG